MVYRLVVLRMVLVAMLALFGAAVARAEIGGEALSALPGLTPLQGEPVAAADLTGRPVVVSFFASWCPPCHAEFRHLNAVQARYGATVAIVAVNVFEDFGGLSSPQQLQAFLDKTEPTFAVLAGSPSIRRLYGDLERIPSVFVFDPSGRLHYRFIHRRGAEKTHIDEAELIAALQPFL